MTSPSSTPPRAPSILSEDKLSRIRTLLSRPEFIPEGDAALFARLDRKTGETQFVTVGDIHSENILRLGSLTKTFLAFIALKHGVPIDKTVYSEMKNLEPSRYPSSDLITFRMLMNHTSGIFSYTELANATTLSEHFSPPVIVDLAWKDTPLRFPAGSKFFYSNTNSEMIGYWLMQKTGSQPKDLFNAEFRDNGFPTLYLADGEDRDFPRNTSGYRSVDMPYHFPSVSGTLQGTANDCMMAFDRMAKETEIWENMKSWRDPSIPLMDDPDNPAGGDRYGFFLQEYNFRNGVKGYGHDGHIGVVTLAIVIQEHVYLIHATQEYTAPRWMEFCHPIIDEIFSDPSN